MKLCLTVIHVNAVNWVAHAYERVQIIFPCTGMRCYKTYYEPHCRMVVGFSGLKYLLVYNLQIYNSLFLLQPPISSLFFPFYVTLPEILGKHI